MCAKRTIYRVRAVADFRTRCRKGLISKGGTGSSPPSQWWQLFEADVNATPSQFETTVAPEAADDYPTRLFDATRCAYAPTLPDADSPVNCLSW